MELKGEFEVKSDRSTVASFVSDIDRIVKIVPEVQSIERLNDSSARLVVKAGQSAIKGKFNLLLEIGNKVDGEQIEITARGSSTTGSLDLRASYSFSDSEGGTIVNWVVNITIGGMIATMGSRVINSTAEKYVTVLTESFRKSFEK